jgi:hypothetical protein
MSALCVISLWRRLISQLAYRRRKLSENEERKKAGGLWRQAEAAQLASQPGWRNGYGGSSSAAIISTYRRANGLKIGSKR